MASTPEDENHVKESKTASTQTRLVRVSNADWRGGRLRRWSVINYALSDL